MHACVEKIERRLIHGSFKYMLALAHLNLPIPGVMNEQGMLGKNSGEIDHPCERGW